MMYNILSAAIRWKIYDFPSNGSCNVFSSFHRLRNIHDARKKWQNYGLENECQRQRVDERDLG